jgi:hypothetical protein
MKWSRMRWGRIRFRRSVNDSLSRQAVIKSTSSNAHKRLQDADLVIKFEHGMYQSRMMRSRSGCATKNLTDKAPGDLRPFLNDRKAEGSFRSRIAALGRVETVAPATMTKYRHDPYPPFSGGWPPRRLQ